MQINVTKEASKQMTGAVTDKVADDIEIKDNTSRHNDLKAKLQAWRTMSMTWEPQP